MKVDRSKWDMVDGEKFDYKFSPPEMVQEFEREGQTTFHTRSFLGGFAVGVLLWGLVIVAVFV